MAGNQLDTGGEPRGQESHYQPAQSKVARRLAERGPSRDDGRDRCVMGSCAIASRESDRARNFARPWSEGRRNDGARFRGPDRRTRGAIRFFR
jgi:hypothetical protein